MTATRVIVGGALANRPGNGGGAWVRLSFARGLRALGFDVLFVEQIARATCRDDDGVPTEPADSANLAWFRSVTERFGLADTAALVLDDGTDAFGRTLDGVLDFARDTELLVNISGHLTLAPLLAAPRLRAFVDLDPGFTQIWHAAGIAEAGGHDAYFTVGENIGRPGCTIPTGGIPWQPLRQPVVLEDWPVGAEGDGNRFTTVASWRGPYAPVEHGGRRLGVKAHEFRRFLALPRSAPQELELALDIDPADAADRDALLRAGWRLVDPAAVAGDPEAFRAYVTASGGEFSPAQGVYVHTASGWFSDRTVRYLAAGRPALVQDTGVPWVDPDQGGLLTFRTLEEAIAGARTIADDYDAHRRAARALAEERFDARKVLAGLADAVGVAA